jgi:hypothetical protein
MADDQPEMIPMPGPGQPGPGPGELTRQLSPEEERAALLNFMGNMYGEAKKMDNNIVGPSNTLQRGKSEEIKKQIEQVYTQPQQPAPPQAAPTPQPEVQQPQVQSQQPLQPVQQVMVQSEVDDNQLSFNFDTNEKDELFSLIEKILTRLDKLHRNVDEMSSKIKNNNVTSLPVRKHTKKKSVEKKEEV